MVNEKAVSHPFGEVSFTSLEMNELQVVAKTIIEANLEQYNQFLQDDNGKVNPNKWKAVKSKNAMRVYLERQRKRRSPSAPTNPDEDSTSDLLRLMCTGSIPGALDDVMYGIVSPTLKGTRTKSSYVDGLNGTAVLSTVREPTVEEPYQSVVVKWMELDVRLRSMGLVKNRDYVYVESTGGMDLPSGGRLGYHVMHSIDFPQACVLPGRVRAKLSVCSFFQQESEESVSVYVMGIMDPMSRTVRRFVVPKFINTLMSAVKYAHCGEMKKLVLALGKRYAELKNKYGPPNADHECITCNKSMRVNKKLTFVTPDLELAQRRQLNGCGKCLAMG
ncbi:hypothetical protein BBP00_00003630 [Phytophthora kernoviae]|uniref:START domain-containing protein n=1 Tax=Phytophthora kernoviae TaxID=325452 RepID=A0A3F2RVS3_9STRA|nr:hypothetical protein BBP00_00003630 [Phytophthora kernoviae]